jgi:hypothetical protein
MHLKSLLLLPGGLNGRCSGARNGQGKYPFGSFQNQGSGAAVNRCSRRENIVDQDKRGSTHRISTDYVEHALDIGRTPVGSQRGLGRRIPVPHKDVSQDRNSRFVRYTLRNVFALIVPAFPSPQAMQGHGHNRHNMGESRFPFNPFSQQGTQEPPDAGAGTVLELVGKILERCIELEPGKGAVKIESAARTG